MTNFKCFACFIGQAVTLNILDKCLFEEQNMLIYQRLRREPFFCGIVSFTHDSLGNCPQSHLTARTTRIKQINVLSRMNTSTVAASHSSWQGRSCGVNLRDFRVVLIPTVVKRFPYAREADRERRLANASATNVQNFGCYNGAAGLRLSAGGQVDRRGSVGGQRWWMSWPDQQILDFGRSLIGQRHRTVYFVRALTGSTQS